ncbi:MAG: RraA family protein [Gemmatimonadota bacterium]
MRNNGAGRLDTSAVSDALDRLGIAGQAHGIRPLDPRFRLWGRAFTVRLVPTTGRGGTVGDFIDDVDPEGVVVLDNGGRADASVWGDLLTQTAERRGVGGTVIHGVCRDSARIRDLWYPVFSRGTYMRTGKDRVRAETIGELVSLGHASVVAGDLIVGDADGVVVVPRAQEEAVLDLAREIADAEDRIREAIKAGGSLREARRAVGYHRLQRTS